MRGLSKTFGPTRVLDDVELAVEPGEIHGLAGQNGSGKSTLIKILTGIHAPDPGARVSVDDRPLRLPVHWRTVHAAGVSVVHQDLGLLDRLTVAENICVGGFPTTRVVRRIDTGARDRLAEETLLRMHVQIDAGRRTNSLSAPERAEVAIARALRDHVPGSGLVILDESTRALAGTDLARVHALLRRLAAEGTAVLMISHNLPELLAVADRLTVLRDGRLAGSGLPVAQLSEAEVAHRMLGAEHDEAPPRARGRRLPRHLDRPHVAVTGLQGGRITHKVNMSFGRGEVVGLTGLPGSGYEEIPYLLTGAQRATGGRLEANGTRVDLARATVASCLRAGVVLVPERRERDGLAFDLSIRDNISVPMLRRRGRPWFVGRQWQRAAADAATDTYDIRPRNQNLLIKQLSGGNQQKVLLAKWLNAGPALVILHEPTQAVDIGARRDILRVLRNSSESGVSILLVSSEADDLAAACDRVLVYRPGAALTPIADHSADGIIAEIYQDPEMAGTSR